MGNSAVTSLGTLLDDQLDATRQLVNRVEKAVSAHVVQTFDADGVLAITADNKLGFLGRFIATTTPVIGEVVEGDVELGIDLDRSTKGELDTNLRIHVEVTLDRPALKGPGVS
jgi:hypothetical protein